MKMWDGRFSKSLDNRVNDFNSSISFDSRMFEEDITGSVAHAKMLAKCRIITENDRDIIVRALLEILSDIKAGNLDFDPEAEDIHMFVEAELTARIGDTGKRLHTARSRNDQVALDIRMYIKKEIINLESLIRQLVNAILTLAEENTETIMPGYTHLQRAQPITFAHHILAYAEMLLRDLGRLGDCKKRTDSLPLGACALATTSYPIDRRFVADELGFADICKNSIDAVSDRDFVIELASCLSICMMHLSRFSEEIILWSSSEFAFIELDDAFSTGSSIMPQKKNPDVAELVRGKTGRVYGDLTALLTAMKGLPLAYNKDMQEDKEAIFDAIDTVKMCLATFTPMLATITVKKEKMTNSVKSGFVNATDFADYLVSKGLPFRDAYKISGRVVAYCTQNGTCLDDLDLDTYNRLITEQGINLNVEPDLYDVISPSACVERRLVIGGPAPATVIEAIKDLKNRLI